jgi:hypothetical protein
MLEFMNMAILEVNARRRVETIADDMKASRREPAVMGVNEAAPAATRRFQPQSRARQRHTAAGA